MADRITQADLKRLQEGKKLKLGSSSLKDVAEAAMARTELKTQLVAPKRKETASPKKKRSVDYNAICALPTWKAETTLGLTFYTLPMPPSANVYWRNVKGKTLVSAEAKSYKKEVAKLAHRLGMRPLNGDVRLVIQVYRNQASGDLSNRIKVIEDALNGVGYFDDSQVVQILAQRLDDKGNGRIVIGITN